MARNARGPAFLTVAKSGAYNPNTEWVDWRVSFRAQSDQQRGQIQWHFRLVR